MIILTGASGYLGRNFVEDFEKKEELLCLARRKTRLNARQEIVDFREQKHLEKFINKGDVIVHVLGQVSGKKEGVIYSNFEITKRIVDACKSKKAGKIIFISTAIVGMKREGVYGRAKRMAEEYVKESKISYVILRPSIIYGRDDSKFLGLLRKVIKTYKIAPIIGNGNYFLKPVHIDDVIEIIKKAIYMNIKNKTYLLAQKNKISLNEVCRRISASMSLSPVAIHIPLKFIKIASVLNRINSKFPSKEQLDRIEAHEDYDVSETEKDFKIKFREFS